MQTETHKKDLRRKRAREEDDAANVSEDEEENIEDLPSPIPNELPATRVVEYRRFDIDRKLFLSGQRDTRFNSVDGVAAQLFTPEHWEFFPFIQHVITTPCHEEYNRFVKAVDCAKELFITYDPEKERLCVQLPHGITPHTLVEDIAEAVYAYLSQARAYMNVNTAESGWLRLGFHRRRCPTYLP
jgi:hypothetical protein